jgi:hypothetical protein
MKMIPTAEQKTIFKFVKDRPENILIEAFAGSGKCLGFNTPILMYDGSIKNVQDIVIGDQLMGDDSLPKDVLNTNIGSGELYKIIPMNGDEWICNDVHVLTIHNELSKKLMDIPLNELKYPKYPNGNYRYARLQRIGVEFSEKKMEIDPYLMGLWLGDGTKENGSPCITVHASETPILNYLKNIKYVNITPKFNEYVKNIYTVSLTTPNFNGRKVNNVLRDEFKKCLNNDGSFSIPDNYLRNSKINRLKLLAGIIDTDGNNAGKYYEIITKYKSFADDLLYLSRSLGFAAYCKPKSGTIKPLNFTGNYYRINISGSFEELPCLLERKICEPRLQIKSVLRTGFKTEAIGIGNYYGFTLNGNGRFLLGDFTITHNTTTIVEAVKLLPSSLAITFLAFNKHIKEELSLKLPEYVKCYTTYGLGYAAIMRKYKNKIKFDELKIDKIIQKKAKSWSLSDNIKNESDKYIYFGQIKRLVDACRLTLTLKPEYVPYISDRYDIGLNKPEDMKRVLKVLDAATNDRLTFDYTDMVYLPAVDNSIWMFPQDVVFVDECLPKDSYISTEMGKLKIYTLFNKFNKNETLPMVTTFNEESKIFEYKKIKNIWCNGIKNVHYVMLGGKRKLKSTVNHRFLTDNGWKRLDELKIGDAIISNYNDQPYHEFLNESQKEIFIGSIIGDGHLDALSEHINRIRVIHGANQLEYIKWKASFFDLALTHILENGFSKKLAHTFGTQGFFINTDKERAINELTAKSLAIAWMDDANINKNNYLSSRLYSYANDLNLITKLSDAILNKFGIASKIKNSNSSSTGILYYFLTFNKENTIKISKLISPFIHKSMDYKIMPEHRLNISENNWRKSEKSNIGCCVVTKEHTFYKSENVYDISVEDNHNFIITSKSMGIKKSVAGGYGIVAHNCQDMNRCQIRIIEKILKKDKVTGKTVGRLIAVGDYFQGIYGFNFSDDKSFQWFRDYKNTSILPLSYSFRCAKNIILKANEIVPDIKALETAPEGTVREGSILKEAESGDFVLCRTTAPLIRLFFELLVQHKKAVIKGKDIGDGLIEMIKDHKTIDKMIYYWETKLFNMKRDLAATQMLNPEKHTGYVALEDKVLTLTFLGRLSQDIIDLKAKISMIFSDDNGDGIILSTIHKAKGSEANRVFIARPDLMPLPCSRGWQMAQEKNLAYVAITRAKHELIYDNEWTDEKMED